MGHIRLGVKQPLTVAPDVTVHAAARAMADRNVGAAGVVENDRLVGIMTERDVLRRVVAPGGDPMSARVADVMSSPVLSVTLNTSVADAATIMRNNHIRHLAVLGTDGKLAGILALQYVLYDMLDDFERNVGDLMGFIMADSPGG